MTSCAAEDDFGGFRDFPAILRDHDGLGFVVAEVDVNGGVGEEAAGGADADDVAAGVAVAAGAESSGDVMQGVAGEGLAGAAEEAVAEPIVEESVAEGEGLVDVGERDEGLAEGGGEGGVLGELQEQAGDGGAMLGGGGGGTA